MIDLKALFALPPAEAVAYMQARGLLTPTFSWQDLLREEHAVQFTVAKLSRLDLLDAIYRECVKNAEQGQTLRDFAKNLRPLLEKEGWWGKRAVIDPKTGEIGTTTFDPARLKLIYDVNLRTAHNAGQWERIERNQATHPYLRYVTRRDERVRHSHKAWDNVTLPVGHPFWLTHSPPNGWRCRCGLVAMTRKEYDAGLAPNGQSLVKSAPEIQMVDWKDRNGTIHQIPAGIDPGWDYNPGKAALRAKNLEQVTADKLAAASPPIRAAALKAGLGDNAGMNKLPTIQAIEAMPAEAARKAVAGVLSSPEFSAFAKGAGTGAYPVAVASTEIQQALGVEVKTIRLSADDRDKQVRKDNEAGRHEYAMLQLMIDAGWIIQYRDNAVSLYEIDGEWFHAAIHATLAGDELYLKSLRRASAKQLERDIKRGTVIQEGKKVGAD